MPTIGFANGSNTSAGIDNDSGTNATSFLVSTSGGADPASWAPGDWFGWGAYGAWPQGTPPGVPFGIADDSVFPVSGSTFAPDTQGIIDSRTAATDEFFSVIDLVNGANAGGSATAIWEFDISGASALSVSIDFAAMGDFETSNDSYTFTYSIDGATALPLFSSSVNEAGNQSYTMESGATPVLNDPLLINGTLLNDELQTLTASIPELGSTLTLQFDATTDGGSEGFVFDNIRIDGALAPSRETFAFDLVGGASQNRLSFTNPFNGAFSSAGDGFQVFQRFVSPSIPFAVVDDSLSIFTPDTQGIIGEFNTDPFFGVVDTVNNDNTSGDASATWEFDIAGFSDLELAIDMGAMGDFETSDVFTWSYSIDGTPAIEIFSSSVDEAASQAYTLESGTTVALADPMRVNGVLLDNTLQTIIGAITGTGSMLALTLDANFNGGEEAYAFQNIQISGVGEIPSQSVILTESAGDTAVSEDGATDTYTLALSEEVDGPVTVEIAADDQLEVSSDGISFASTISLDLTDIAPQTVTVRAVDDSVFEGSIHDGLITHTITASADPDFGDDLTPIRNLSVTIAENDFILTPIPEIQGTGATSPIAGQPVLTRGVVTAVDTTGFYMQDADGDGDDATSDGIFVFTAGAPSATVGDLVEVEGVVSEFGGGTNLSLTQISNVFAVEVISGGNAITPVKIGGDGRTIPNDSVANGIAFYETIEGMLVEIVDPVAVSPTDGAEIYVVADEGANSPSFSSRGTNNNGPEDFNPERLLVQVDSGLGVGSAPAVDVGATLADITAVVTYSGGEYEFNPTVTLAVEMASELEPETTALGGDEETLTVATYNVLNLDPGDGASRFAGLGEQIVNNLGLPDIIGLQEIQDNDGPTNSDIVSASDTLQGLTDAIIAAGGPTYEFIDNTFIFDDLNGGQPGGNIRTAFLFNPERVDLVGSERGALLPQNDPESPFNGSRLPLAATFAFDGEEVTVVNNHFSSKGGSAPLFGSVQPTDLGQEDPSINGSLNERREQAQAVNDYVDSVLAEDADAKIVVLGDLNEFEFISPLDIVAGTAVSTDNGFGIEESGEPSVLSNLVETLPENERYTFIFEGNSQTLDHILVSSNLETVATLDQVNINVEFFEQFSDHEPLVAALDFGTPSIFSAMLADAVLDIEIVEVADGSVVDPLFASSDRRTISVETTDTAVESVELILRDDDGNIVTTAVENVSPYSLTGDIRGNFKVPEFDFADGAYVLEISGFTEDNLAGTQIGETETIAFTIDESGALPTPNDAFVFSLVDAASDTVAGVLESGVPFDASGVDADQRTVVVEVAAEEAIGSVRLRLIDIDGDLVSERIENVEPYFLFGDIDGDAFGPDFDLESGSYAIEATAFSGASGRGEVIDTALLAFTLEEMSLI